ncbi:AMP-binding protein [Herbidospora yilanensis]|uniref:AMP-binding protein n=1 Tax=Herbidospora yilanensis TaxID=354426 RepID=UPI00078235D8|nr:AMP-binding protein [Herbidospora yilanensis]
MVDRPVHALILPPGPALAEAVAAALDGGGPAILPVAPSLPDRAVRALFDTLRPTHVTTPGGTSVLPGGVPAEDDTAVIIATSGSTGVPKGIELSARALLASARASLDRIGAGPGDRWLCCLPPSHVSGLQVITRALLCGTDPIVHESFDPEKVMAAGADHVSLVPTQLRRLPDVSAFTTILLGGAPATADLKARHARIFHTYGMTETCGGCVYDGRPLDNVDLKLDAEGRVMIAGPMLMNGHRLGPRLSGPWFTTSDLGEIDDGELRILGRADDVINTGGQKVVAGVVQNVLATHPKVREVVVVGRPDPEWGQIVVAVVAGEATLEELRGHAKSELPAYAAPKALVQVTALPLLPNGKPDMVAIRNQV